jgi:hypothetical protein
MPIKQNLKYSSWKKVEYDKAKRRIRDGLKKDTLKQSAYPKAAENIADYIKNTSELELSLLPRFNQERITSISKRLGEGTGQAANIRMRSVLKDSVTSMLDLGTRHTIMDMLYQIPDVKNIFKRKLTRNFSSLTGDLTTFVLDNAQIANFNDYDDLNAKDRKDIEKAEKYLDRMADSLDKLEERGDLDDFPDKLSRLTRQSYEERYRYLYLITNIDNYRKRAEASKNSFVSDEYLRRRHGVLAQDFGSTYDEYIKSILANFLQEESRYMTSIKNKDIRIDELKEDIRRKLMERDINNLTGRVTDERLRETIAKRQQAYENRAEMFIATETSTAYNFGKLIGFSSIEDSNKKFTWNADWELMTRNSSGDYEVCQACSDMDGNTYPLSELIENGVNLDVGPGGYGSNRDNRTDFKNPSIPQIPFHPHCNCYWTFEPDLKQLELEEQGEEAPIDSQQAEQPVDSPTAGSGNTLATVAGAGLLVGGAFLLSRSNYWQTFLRATSRPYRTTGGALSTIVMDTGSYITREFDDDIATSVLRILLEQLRNLLNRGRR